ncbi:MAG TPA: trypsin-like peptidase domain-containing protein [Spirochaetota bacterium]|nr:trypsin-like peptidase domain-containing protein [Spirochaetota bacterium]HRT76395.1 trypsin-like peptidase domain-containing protein [Spirochaetota bacterium]
MKEKIKFIVPLAVLTVMFALYQFSCFKSGDSTLFGDIGQSPLRKEAETAQAVEIQDTFRKIFNLYKDRVVFITTEQVVRVQPNPFFDDPFMREFFGGGANRARTERRRGLGSGFIISEDGYVCTNYHVVAGVDMVTVGINEKTYKATIVGSDERTDLALLKINVPGKLKPVYLGDSDRVQVGDWAVAIGNPFGLDRTFTVGVVSAIGRRDVDMMGGSHIQTDASINPGNSGGPLINIYGEVIGINRMIYSQSGGYMGIGFAIPINTARSILEQLKTHKKIKRGYIGVSIAQITEEYAQELGLKTNQGAFVGEVIQGSPAERGGVRVGDIILKINDRDIGTYMDLLKIVGEMTPGQTLKLTIWRQRKTVTLYVKVVERPD